jgi:hypothetical protein
VTGCPAGWHYRPFQPQSIRCQLARDVSVPGLIGKAHEVVSTGVGVDELSLAAFNDGDKEISVGDPLLHAKSAWLAPMI